MVRRLARARIPFLRLRRGAPHRLAVGRHPNGRDVLHRDLSPQLEHESDRSLRVDHRRVRLEAGARDPERLGAAAEARPRRRGDGEVLPEAVAALERLRRTGHAVGGQLRREHAGAHGGRRRTALPHRELADPRHAEWHARRDRDRDRVAQPRAVQAEDPARATRGADGGVHALVPAPERHLVGQPAEHLVRGGDRRDHRAAGGAMRVGDRQHAGDHVARVARAARRVRVVAVEVADQRGVRERGELGRGRLAGAEEPRRRRAAHARRRPARDDRGLAVERAEAAAERVHQRAFHLVHGLLRQVVVGQPARVVAQALGGRVHPVLLARGPRAPASRAGARPIVPGAPLTMRERAARLRPCSTRPASTTCT